ncbi:MAG: hypothetical protein ACYDA2_00365 [Acidimicrobiales bacterium]
MGSAHLSAPSGTPLQIVLASVDRTESVQSAAVDIDISVAGTPSLGGLVPDTAGTAATPVSIHITGHGVFDFPNKTGQMTIGLPATGQSGAVTLQLREIGDLLYLSSPDIASLDGNKPWVEVNLADYLAKQGQSAGPLGGFTDGDPTQVLAMLRQLTGGVTQVGSAVIDGEQTTEYQGTIDLAGTNGGSTSSTIISRQLAQAFGLSSLPVDVWIDGAGRARQVKTSFTLFGLTVSALTHIGSFGTPVSVSAPPPSQTTDGTSLLNSGQLGNVLGSGSVSG